MPQLNIRWILPTAVDNSGREPHIESVFEPESEFSLGNTVVRYRATDGSGNMAMCAFNVTLIPIEHSE